MMIQRLKIESHNRIFLKVMNKSKAIAGIPPMPLREIKPIVFKKSATKKKYNNKIVRISKNTFLVYRSLI